MSADEIRGFRADLNGDGVKEYFIRSPELFCGTGGCGYEIFDGQSKHRIASLFGNPMFVHPRKINGWPVLTVYSHHNADSGSYTTYVFDGKAYVEASSVFLSGDSVRSLFDSLQDHELREPNR
ncbi:MAG: hypothetical protein ACT4QA_13955 [Panacagrimonas sp.]